MRARVAEECKNDYAAQLQKYNKEQSQFYFNDMPLIFNVSELAAAHKPGICRCGVLGKHWSDE